MGGWQDAYVPRKIYLLKHFNRRPQACYLQIFINVQNPSRSERETGLDDLQSKKDIRHIKKKEGTAGLNDPRAGTGRTASEVKNFHPTVKPTKPYIAWLCRLLTPKAGSY